jgi:DNA-binding transcriptional LysR family regulator
MNWNALYGFWLVAEHGSFARAARSLPNGSIQALHRRVRNLEDGKLDLKLLKSRGVKGIQLTEAGQRLHDLVDPVFRSLDVLVAELRGEDRGSLDVAMSHYAIANHAGKILESFRRAFPRVSMRLHSCQPADAISLLEAGRVDVAISSPWMGAQRVDVRAAAPIPFELVFANHYRLGRRLTWPEVLRHPLVLTDRNSVIRQAFEELLRRENLLSQLKIATEASSPDLAIEAVRAGFGIGICPVGPAAYGSLQGLRRRLPPTGLPRIEICVLCRSDVYLPRYIEAFMEIAASRIRAGAERDDATTPVTRRRRLQ